MDISDLVSYWSEVVSKDLTYNTVFYYTPEGKDPELCIATVIKDNREYEDGCFMYISKTGCHTTNVWVDVGRDLFIDKKYEVVQHCDSFYDALQTFHQIDGSGRDVLMKVQEGV